MNPASTKCKLVILISGGGSNLQSFIDAIETGNLNAEIAAVFCNKPSAFGLTRAANAGITTEVIDHTTYDNRDSFDRVLMDRISDYSPDLIILAGFMRILTPRFLPTKCKNIFISSKKEGLTNQEISEKFNISTKTVEGQITKAFKFLKRCVRIKFF